MMLNPYAEDPCGAEQGFSGREVMAEVPVGLLACPSRLTRSPPGLAQRVMR